MQTLYFQGAAMALMVASAVAFSPATPFVASLRGSSTPAISQKANFATAFQPVALRSPTARHASFVSGVQMLDSTNIAMPALSSTMKEGKIVQWVKQVGDKIEAGDIVMVVESDKADMDVEAFDEGYLSKILVDEGDAAEVGSTVAVLVANEADIGKGGEDAPAAAAAPAEAAPAAPAASGPPSTPIAMPALSSTMKEGKIVQWMKGEGDRVEAGDIVMVVESDKADMDVESFDSGFIGKILVEDGETAEVGAPVALIVENEADVGKVSAPVASAAAPAAAPAAASTPTPVASPAPSASPAAAAATGDRIVASPLAKSLAEERGIDLAGVVGTGPGGRITASDVENAKPGAAPAKKEGKKGPVRPSNVPAGTIMATPQAKKAAKKNRVDLKTVAGTGPFGRITEDDVLLAAGKPPPSKATDTPAMAPTRDIPELPDGPVPLSGMQVAVAGNMMATKAAPDFRVSRRIQTTKFDELYAMMKPKGVTVSALMSKAVALAIEEHPIVNAHYDEASKSIVYKKDINIANAVAIPGGLITPVIKNCNALPIMGVSDKWRELVGKAKEGKLVPDEFTTGTFTISNLGMFGVSQFGSLLPAGSGSILAVGAALPTVKMVNGAPTEVKEMEVTITCDHRHIYGADAALFLKTLAEILEERTIELVL
eukprot:CAMPEP_0202809196 /NCGR_PEP_ID=MMETSP1389-20130828/1568_1 /ASSEMBLY_ACC=CAM_ASM_000865 /TAXON_ID=302021 /ORGANISM="Rhodomonas sp., Strain CCMP768" /LENGTH=657 /DNA_ID=CAMNT_0049479735 /DNA_START=63 /DNA_END=2036 /DNA_ORIENTATION=+